VQEAANGIPTVRVVYLVPADRPVRSDYIAAIASGVRRLQQWLPGAMGNGKSFRLLPQPVEYFVTPHPEAYYRGDGAPGFGFFFRTEADGFALTGGRLNDPENIWIFYIDAEAACGQAAGNGGQGRAIMARGDLDGLLDGRPYDRCGAYFEFPIERWIGGMGHELGHALGLPHPPGCDAGLPTCPGDALMWAGYAIWPNTYLLPSEKAVLDASPFIGLDWDGGPPTSCAFTRSPHAATALPGGGSGTVSVTASAAACPWAAVSNAPWITLSSTGQTGSGALHYTVAPSAGPARQGTITIAGQPFTVMQDADVDADSLPDGWETETGLSAASGAGADGAAGDPDGDGATNAEEHAAGTHPRGFHARYLAEGAANAFFDTRIALLNTSSSLARVQVRFLQPGGAVVSRFVQLPALRRLTLTRADLAQLSSADFSTVIESDQPLAIDRTMSWDGSGFGSHAENGVAAPASTWYLAEGSTAGDFTLFYLLQNPNPEAVSVTIRYLRPFGQPPIEQTRTLPPNSRTTIPVDDQGPQLAATDVSASVTASAPIICERAMYRSTPAQPFAAGHGSAGVVSPALSWFLAEGATGPFFDLFILLANPARQAAVVRVDYLLPDGGVLAKSYTVPAEGRFTIFVDAEELPAGSGLRPLDNVAVSSTVTSTNGVPIVVERTMWWPSPAVSPDYWTEAHNSAGATQTGTRWAVAEGEVGGPNGAETYILIANTSAAAGSARVTLHFEDGPSVERTVALPARSRTTLGVSTHFPAAANRRFGAIVESLGASPVDIVVERAMYTSPGGAVWAAGTNALATRLAPE
jgi:hypothetical protein